MKSFKKLSFYLMFFNYRPQGATLLTVLALWSVLLSSTMIIKNKMKESEDNRNQEKNNKNQELTVVFDNIKNYENQKKDFKNIQKNNQAKIEDNTHNINVLKSRISQITIELEEKKKLIENSPTNHWQTWAAARWPRPTTRQTGPAKSRPAAVCCATQNAPLPKRFAG